MSSGMKSYVDRVISLLVGMSFSHERQTLEGYSTCARASLRYGDKQEVGPMIVHHVSQRYIGYLQSQARGTSHNTCR